MKLVVPNILFLLILISGCTESNTRVNKIQNFPHQSIAVGKELEEIDILTLGGLKVIDTCLILVDPSRVEEMIQVYNINSKEKIFVFGQKGKGANEDYLVPEIINQVTFNNNENDLILHLYDLERRRFSSNNITESIKKDSLCADYWDAPEDWGFITKVFFACDSFLVFSNDRGRFCVQKKTGKDQKLISYLTPDPGFRVLKRDEIQIFRTSVTVNTENRIIAAAPYLIGQLDFFQFSGEYTNSVIFERNQIMEERLYNPSENDIKKIKIFIKQLDSDDNYVYALNGNELNGEIYGKKRRQDSEILVFDWKGNPVERIQLDKHISKIGLDKTSYILYAYCPYEKNLLQYDFSRFNQKNK